MIRTKLSIMRPGATNIIGSIGRIQRLADSNINRSIATATYCTQRYHALNEPSFSLSRTQHIRFYSALSKKHTIANHSLTLPQHRLISTHEISKHIRLLTEHKRCTQKDPDTLRLKTELNKPLVVLLEWLMAKPNHIRKYAQLYIDQGFDVMSVSVSPWQVMWPTKGAQLVAAEVVKFLASNVGTKSPLMLHGFSVGGYLWGECMVHMSRDIDRYRHVVDMIQGQVWDSAVELSEIPLGVPKAMFPRNDTLQRALKNYLEYHLKAFYEPATSHYIRASQVFHSTLVKKPALLLLSNSDPIGSVEANKVLRQSLESLGIRCEWKCWEKSPHVAHFQQYRDDYIHILYEFLQSVNMIQREHQAIRAQN